MSFFRFSFKWFSRFISFISIWWRKNIVSVSFYFVFMVGWVIDSIFGFG